MELKLTLVVDGITNVYEASITKTNSRVKRKVKEDLTNIMDSAIKQIFSPESKKKS